MERQRRCNRYDWFYRGDVSRTHIHVIERDSTMRPLGVCMDADQEKIQFYRTISASSIRFTTYDQSMNVRSDD
ncbi:MAG: hypothetical protein KDA81_16750 [Planctomycetaceae bacterium]|nr:hypothetical protein [Planctomycetaceae bacterium]